MTVKSLVSTKDGGHLNGPILHRREISRVLDFEDGGRPPSWIFETEILTDVNF